MPKVENDRDREFRAIVERIEADMRFNQNVAKILARKSMTITPSNRFETPYIARIAGEFLDRYLREYVLRSGGKPLPGGAGDKGWKDFQALPDNRDRIEVRGIPVWKTDTASYTLVALIENAPGVSVKIAPKNGRLIGDVEEIEKMIVELGAYLQREIGVSQAQPAVASAGDERKEQVDFVLVTALEEERDAVLAQLLGYKKLPPSKDDIPIYFQADLPVAFSDGQEGAYHVIVTLLLGMGRVQAAIATTKAIQRWRPRYILLVGIAGGIANRGVKIGDVLISDQVVDYELQKVTALGQEVRWEIQRADPQLLTACQNFMEKGWQQQIRTQRPDSGEPQRHIGPIASGDKVIAFDEILARYQDVWPKLIGVEMEAAGAAAATFQSAEKPGFFMVRVVSDLADEQKGSAEVEKWRSYACEAAASFAIALLKSGPVSLGEK